MTVSKYHSRRTDYRGETYDSAAEARYAQRLDLLVTAGEIVALGARADV